MGTVGEGRPAGVYDCGMARECIHYESAVAHVLRTRGIPYLATNEARKTLPVVNEGTEGDAARALKSFDFVVTLPGGCGREPLRLLVDVKGRRCRLNSSSAEVRLENWVTREDVEGLAAWEKVFGSPFRAAFAFVYGMDEQPPDVMFREVFEYRGRWYGMRWVLLADYVARMKQRSPRWGTVHVPGWAGQVPECTLAMLNESGAGGAAGGSMASVRS